MLLLLKNLNNTSMVVGLSTGQEWFIFSISGIKYIADRAQDPLYPQQFSFLDLKICGSTEPDPRGKISTKDCKKQLLLSKFYFLVGSRIWIKMKRILSTSFRSDFPRLILKQLNLFNLYSCVLCFLKGNLSRYRNHQRYFHKQL